MNHFQKPIMVNGLEQRCEWSVSVFQVGLFIGEKRAHTYTHAHAHMHTWSLISALDLFSQGFGIYCKGSWLHKDQVDAAYFCIAYPLSLVLNRSWQCVAVSDTFCADRILPRLRKKPNSCNTTSVLYSGLYHCSGSPDKNNLCSFRLF